jgi:FkbM family methyltransferase
VKIPSIRGYLRTRRLKSRLEQPPVQIRQKVSGVEVDFAVHTWIEYHNRARDSYTGEPDTVRWITENVSSGDVLWDIGANVGAFSLLAAKRVPDCSVVAFEPYIPTFAHLWDNIVLNDCSDRIVPLCLGLAQETRQTRLGISNVTAGSSEHVVDGEGFSSYQPLMAFSGDDVRRILDIPMPNLIKMDVDGFEVNVIRGMSDLLNDLRLRSMLIEVDMEETGLTVTETLESAGFTEVDRTLVRDSIFNVRYDRISS